MARLSSSLIGGLIGFVLLGAGLGIFFFGGLHYTVVKGLCSPQPALWFFTSFVFRCVLVLGGFALVARYEPWWLFASLVGFVLARPLVFKVTGRRPTWQGLNRAS